MKSYQTPDEDEDEDGEQDRDYKDERVVIFSRSKN